MADVTRTVQVKVSADSSAFDSGLKGTDKSIGKLGGAFGKLKGDLGGVLGSMGPLGASFASFGAVAVNPITLAGAAVVGLGAALAKSVGAATEFNRSMANVGTLIPGNIERVNELKTSVQDLSISTGKSTKDLSDGLYQVISAFGDSAESAELLGIAAKASAAGAAQTTDAINLLSAVTKGYGDTSAESQQKVSDLAFQTVKLGQTDFPQLASSIGKVVPLAAELKVSQEELFGVMATATGVTGGAAEVSTQLRGVLQSLLAPTADMEKAYQSMGVESGKAALAQFGLQGTIDKIVQTAEAAGVPLTKYLGSIEGTTLALALAGPQADVFTEKIAAMGASTGATEEAFKEITSGVNAQGFAWDQIGNRIDVVQQRIGDALMPVVGVLVGGLADLSEVLLDLLGPALDFVTGLFASFGEQQSGLSSTVTEAWTAIEQATGGALASIQEAVSAGLELLVTAWNEDFQGMRSAVEFAWDAIVAITGGLFTQIGGIISGGLDILNGAFQVVTGIITGEWSKFSGGLKTILAGALDAVLGIFTGSAQAILGVLAGLFKALDKIPGAEKVSAFLGDVSKDLDKTKKAIAGAADEWAGLGKEAKKAESVADVAKAIGGAADKAVKPVVDLGGAMKGLAEDAKLVAKEIEAERKQLESYLEPARYSAEATKEVAKATEEYKAKVMAAAVEAAGLPPVLNDISASAAPVGAGLAALGVGLDEVNIKLKQSDADAGTLEGAYAALGTKSQALKDKELAGLAKAVDDVRAAMMRGDASAVDLKNATDAYAKAAGAGGATTATAGFEKALTDLVGAAQGFGSSLLSVTAEGTVKFGLSLDDLKGKAVSLANEGLKLVIGKLTELIGLGPSVGSFGGILKGALGIGGGAASSAGSAGGGLGGAGGAAGAAGAAAGAGVTAVVGAVAGVASAVSGIIGNFQMKGINKSLDLIEKATRYSEAHLLHLLESFNGAYHGSGSWAWLLRGDTAEIAAALKGGVMLAPGATGPITKAVEAGSDAQVTATEKGSAAVALGGERTAERVSHWGAREVEILGDVSRSTGRIRDYSPELVRIGSSIDAGTDIARQSRDAIVASIVALPEGIGREVGTRISSGGRNPEIAALQEFLASVPERTALGRTADLGPGWFFQGRRIGPGFIDPGESNRIARDAAEDNSRPIVNNIYLDGEPIASRVSEIQAGRSSLQR